MPKTGIVLALLCIMFVAAPDLSAAGPSRKAKRAKKAKAASSSSVRDRTRFPAEDALLKDAYALLNDEDYGKARRKLEGIAPEKYDLGDYALYFAGLSLAREGKTSETLALIERLERDFPDSYLVAYLDHELAFQYAAADNTDAARDHFEVSAGKVTGSDRKAEEGFIAARLLEEEDERKAVEAHLANLTSHSPQEGALLSMERLWAGRTRGTLSALDVPTAFLGRFASALARAGETARAGDVFEEAMSRKAEGDEYYTVVLDYAEFLRREKETTKARALLDRALESAPAAVRAEVMFLRARVDWKAGHSSDARTALLSIADNTLRPQTAERARYLAAWIAWEGGDLSAVAEEFGAIRNARDESIRQESIFRHAFALYLQGRFKDAAAAFEEGEKTGFSTVERARHAYWRAMALSQTGGTPASRILSDLATDPGAGPYALFALRLTGGDPYLLFNAPSSGETAACRDEKNRLWDTVRKGSWEEEDLRRIRRAERLTALGIVDYAIREADQVDREALKKAIGLTNGGTGGLYRYLAGDLRGAIRATSNLPNDPGKVELLDRIQYPLAPEYVGDCDRKKSGIDPLVLHAVIRQESMFQTNVLSPAGAVGLMQLLPRTAAETARREKMRKPARKDLLRPSVNVALGAAYLSRLLKEFDGDYVRAVAAYNAGESAVGRWWADAKGDPARFLEGITYRETRFYVRRVFFNLLQYYLIYRPQMFARFLPTLPKAAPPAPAPEGAAPAGQPPFPYRPQAVPPPPALLPWAVPPPPGEPPPGVPPPLAEPPRAVPPPPGEPPPGVPPPLAEPPRAVHPTSAEPPWAVLPPLAEPPWAVPPPSALPPSPPLADAQRGG